MEICNVTISINFPQLFLLKNPNLDIAYIAVSCG